MVRHSYVPDKCIKIRRNYEDRNGEGVRGRKYH